MLAPGPPGDLGHLAVDPDPAQPGHPGADLLADHPHRPRLLSGAAAVTGSVTGSRLASAVRWRRDSPRKRVLLAKPRGYCAGVDRAVQTVEEALKLYGPPIYVRKEIVHNKHVVTTLQAQGAIFVEENDEVPEGSIVVFSAHGVAPEVYEQAKERSLRAIDATCPLVTKVHHEARRFAAEDYDILLIGHEGHEEVVGTAGEAPAHIQLVDGPDGVDKVTVRDPDKVVWLSQTTLSVDETMETVARLKQRLPLLQSPPSDDICYATQNRQQVVKEIAPECDVVIVVGSQNSSNSVRLVEVALDAGARAGYLVDYAHEIEDGGSTARPRSASPPAPACPRSWSCRCSTTSPSGASTTSPRSPPRRRRSPSRCRRSSSAT